MPWLKVAQGTNEWPNCLNCGQLTLLDGTCLNRECLKERLDEAIAIKRREREEQERQRNSNGRSAMPWLREAQMGDTGTGLNMSVTMQKDPNEYRPPADDEYSKPLGPPCPVCGRETLNGNCNFCWNERRKGSQMTTRQAQAAEKGMPGSPNFEPGINETQPDQLGGVGIDSGQQVLTDQPNIVQERATRSVPTVSKDAFKQLEGWLLEGHPIRRKGWTLIADFHTDTIDLISPEGGIRFAHVTQADALLNDFLSQTGVSVYNDRVATAVVGKQVIPDGKPIGELTATFDGKQTVFLHNVDDKSKTVHLSKKIIANVEDLFGKVLPANRRIAAVGTGLFEREFVESHGKYAYVKISQSVPKFDPKVNAQQPDAVSVPADCGDLLGPYSSTDESIMHEFDIGKVPASHPMQDNSGTSTGAADKVGILLRARIKCDNCTLNRIAYLKPPVWIKQPQIWEECVAKMEESGKQASYPGTVAYYKNKCKKVGVDPGGKMPQPGLTASREYFACPACRNGKVAATYAPPSKTLGPDGQTNSSTEVFDRGVNHGKPHTSVPKTTMTPTDNFPGPDSPTNADTSYFDPGTIETSRLGPSESPKWACIPHKDGALIVSTGLMTRFAAESDDAAAEKIEDEAIDMLEDAQELEKKEGSKDRLANAVAWELRERGINTDANQVKHSFKVLSIYGGDVDGLADCYQTLVTAQRQFAQMYNQGLPVKMAQELIQGDSMIPEIQMEPGANTPGNEPPTDPSNQVEAASDYDGPIGGTVEQGISPEASMPGSVSAPKGGMGTAGGTGLMAMIHDRNVSRSADPAERYREALRNKPSARLLKNIGSEQDWLTDRIAEQLGVESPEGIQRQASKATIQSATNLRVTFRADLTQNGTARYASNDGLLSVDFGYDRRAGTPNHRDIQAFMDACSGGERAYRVIDLQTMADGSVVRAHIREASDDDRRDASLGTEDKRTSVRWALGKDAQSHGQSPEGMGSDYNGTIMNREGQEEDWETQQEGNQPFPTGVAEAQAQEPWMTQTHAPPAQQHLPHDPEQGVQADNDYTQQPGIQPDRNPIEAQSSMCPHDTDLMQVDCPDCNQVPFGIESQGDSTGISQVAPVQGLEPGKGTENDHGKTPGSGKIAAAKPPKTKVAPKQSARISEGWGDAGEYNREVEADGPEDVWKLHQSVQGRDVDWTPRMAPGIPGQQPVQPPPGAEGPPPADAAPGGMGGDMPEPEPESMSGEYVPEQVQKSMAPQAIGA
jgi:hypothetical protein